ncbi:putative leucine-rich repeat domain, L domain-containing protein [Medicago truncatula]|uniref:Putative leucine-rich repeat domain, L domain-containing protein n=1 Tax=Medicago truncatula TaxID=3880 RepID=A0A396H0K7_MEDTR|nr:putative leucine-rich repeat domain, L domain-containing protein [Medicago truncatula]
MSATLGILSNFVTLDLSSNCLEGPIQEKSLEKLFELKEPRLPSTNVSQVSVLVENAKFRQIEVLTMSNSGRLPSVSTNIDVLNIANNSISGPISSTFLCKKMNFENKLTVLDVSNNLLSGDLGHCWIHWQNLMHLNLGRNNLSGEIPNPIGFLSELESLLLDDNDFYGSIPSTLQNCSMKFIDLGNNKLSDTLPSWIWEMQYLMVLRLRSNEFKGCITQKMCQLSSLIVLDIANNSLSGTIPNCLNEMKTLAGEDDFFANPLKYFYGFGFNYNNYKESLVLVPKGDELEYRDNLILVRMIDLSSNNLFRTIPPQISKLSALRFLNLSRNRLYGDTK